MNETTGRGVAHRIEVLVVSSEEAEHGVAEFWADGELFGFTRLEEGEVILWIEPRSDGAPVLVNAQAQEGFRSRTSGITTTMDQLNGKHNGASGVGTGTWQQAWPHTVFIEFEDRDGERFEAEIRVTSVTQAEATEKVRDLLERLDAQVEPSREAAFQHAA